MTILPVQLINDKQVFKGDLQSYISDTCNLTDDIGFQYNVVAVFGSQSTGKSTTFTIQPINYISHYHIVYHKYIILCLSCYHTIFIYYTLYIILYYTYIYIYQSIVQSYFISKYMHQMIHLSYST